MNDKSEFLELLEQKIYDLAHARVKKYKLERYSLREEIMNEERYIMERITDILLEGL